MEIRSPQQKPENPFNVAEDCLDVLNNNKLIEPGCINLQNDNQANEYIEPWKKYMHDIGKYLL